MSSRRAELPTWAEREAVSDVANEASARCEGILQAKVNQVKLLPPRSQQMKELVDREEIVEGHLDQVSFLAR